METAEEPLGKRYLADKLAILCATRPFQYVLLRILAAIILVLALSFVFDAIALLSARIARSAVAIFFSGDLSSKEDREAVASIAGGFPYDLPRLTTLGIMLVVLIAVQLLATRDLPPGLDAMKSSIVKGLPWPGSWRLAARCARILRPWLITISGFAVMTWLARKDWPLSGRDWASIPGVLLIALVAAWLAAYVGSKGGAALTLVLPSFGDVTIPDVRAARQLVERQDKEEAERHWPHKQALRLPAAVCVFGTPPTPGQAARSGDGSPGGAVRTLQSKPSLLNLSYRHSWRRAT